MRRLAIASLLVCVALCIFFAFRSMSAYAMESRLGWCEDGNYTVTVPGATGPSVNKYQRSFSSCTVTVYLTGTLTLATIYSDNAGTAKANPFTAASSGQYVFYAANGYYDIKMSGGGIASPFTLSNVGIGGSGGPTINCAAYNGTSPNDAGGKLIACHAALPATGGVLDARNLVGAQVISTTVNFTKPVTLLLGASTFSCSAAPCFTSNAALTVMGGGRNVTVFTESITTNTVFAHASVNPFQIRDLTIQSGSAQTAGCGVSITGAGGSSSNNRSRVENVQFLFPWVGICSLNTAYSKYDHNDFNGIELAGIQLNDSYSSDEGDNTIESNLFSPDCITPGVSCNTTTSYGIELISSSMARIVNNKFQQNFQYETYVHWTGQGITPATVGFNYLSNWHEWPLANGAAVYLDASTGSLVDMTFVDNRFISIANNESGIVFAANAYQAFARPTITGNVFDFIFGTSNMLSFLGNANGDVATINGNVFYGGLGTGTAINVVQTGSNYGSLSPGLNNYQGVAAYFTLTGATDPRTGAIVTDRLWAGFGAPPTLGTLTDSLNVPNGTGLSAENSTASGEVVLIHLNSSNVVEIAGGNNNMVTGTGSFLAQGGVISSTYRVNGGAGPTISSANGVPMGNCVIGSIYMRTDGPSASTSVYICSTGNTWNALTVP
jgi:hypothetical protein